MPATDAAVSIHLNATGFCLLQLLTHQAIIETYLTSSQKEAKGVLI